MDTFLQFFQMIVHFDQSLGEFIKQYGTWVYIVLFLIIFCETGLVIFPFLPGDSLLFIAGAYCATEQLHLGLMMVLLFLASVLGNTVNYAIGRKWGVKLFATHLPVISYLLDRRALVKTHAFYERHGGKTLLLARFTPVIRTFAPFVAGASTMRWMRFQLFNVISAVIWIGLLLIAGYFFGNIPFIRQHLSLIVLLGLFAAVVPIVLGLGLKLFMKKSS